MDRVPEDPEIEDRIRMEVVIDADGPEEQAAGWHTALGDRLAFPFAALCTAEPSVSPLRPGERVRVVGMADADDCACEMFVEVEWHDRRFGVPLAQLEPEGADEETEQAAGDWRYWVGRGYRLC